MMFTFLAGLASLALLALGFWCWRMSRRAAHWPSTQGLIIESFVDDADPDTRRPRVRYRYFVAGQQLEGWRVAYSAYGASRRAMELFIAPYVQGATVPVHYDPALPTRSVLDNRPTKDWLLCLVFALGFAALAVYLHGR